MRDTLLHIPTIIAGVFLGLVALPFGAAFVQFVQEKYDDTFPVLTGVVRITEFSQDHVVIDMLATKNRECDYVRLVAYTVTPSGVRFDARISRIGESEGGYTRTPGTYKLGKWMVQPRQQGTVGVRIEAIHSCGGRLVRSLVGETKIV